MSADDKLRNSLHAGHKLHWYEIEKVLGQGGFGITYLAYDTNLDQHVAIKEYLPMELAVREGDFSVYPASQAQDSRYRWGLERFLSEARTLARFKHAAIVRVLSVFEANNTAYMVMEYQQGHSLQQLLDQRRTLPEHELVTLTIPLLDGLEVIHAQGFIHRDIKPSNIFIRTDGQPVLLDFGSARQALGEETRTLTSVVSPGYAPFEQYYSKSDRQGPWTDIYGLGATLYRCLTGLQPMAAIDRSEAILRSERDVFVTATEIGAGQYSASFLNAVDCALFFNETKRPQSIAQWRQYFEFSTSTENAVRDQLHTSVAEDARTRFSAVLDDGAAREPGASVNPYARDAAGSAASPSGRSAAPVKTDRSRSVPSMISAAAADSSGRTDSVPSVRHSAPSARSAPPAPHDRAPPPMPPREPSAPHSAAYSQAPPPSRRHWPYAVLIVLVLLAAGGFAAYSGLIPNSLFGGAKASRLVVQGDRALAAGQIYEPPMTSALAFYRRAWELDPGHPDAEHGLRLTGEHVTSAIVDALAANKLERAEALNARLEGFPPDLLDLSAIRGQLAAARAGAGEADKQRQRIAAFLRAAEEDVHNGNYVGSGTDNALARYRAVQILDPDNAVAASGLSALAAAVAERGQAAIAAAQHDEAARWHTQAALIDGTAAAVVELGSALRAAQAAASTQQERAESIDKLLAAAAGDLAGNRLSTPPGNNALDRYREIESLDPGNRDAREGLRRVHDRYLVLSRRAMEQNEFAQAAQFAARALSIETESEAARALQREIVTARQRHDAEQSRLLAAEAEAEAEVARAAQEQARRDAETERRRRQEAEAQRLLAAAQAKAEAERQAREAQASVELGKPRMVLDFHGFHPKYARDGLTRDLVYQRAAPLVQAAGYEIVTRGQVHDAGYKWTNVKLMAYRLYVNENTATGLYSYNGSLNVLADATLRVSLAQALESAPLWNRGHNGLGPPNDLGGLLDVYIDMTRAFLEKRPGRVR